LSQSDGVRDRLEKLATTLSLLLLSTCLYSALTLTSVGAAEVLTSNSVRLPLLQTHVDRDVFLVGAPVAALALYAATMLVIVGLEATIQQTPPDRLWDLSILDRPHAAPSLRLLVLGWYVLVWCSGLCLLSGFVFHFFWLKRYHLSAIQALPLAVAALVARAVYVRLLCQKARRGRGILVASAVLAVALPILLLLRPLDLRNAVISRIPEDWKRAEDQALNRVVGADLSLVPSLAGANLVHAFLPLANLSRVRLEGAQLAGADLTEATLTEARLEGARFQGAILVGAKLNKAQAKNANFTRADLTEAVLDGADLQDAIFVSTKFSSTTARGANLCGATTITNIPGLCGDEFTKASVVITCCPKAHRIAQPGTAQPASGNCQSQGCPSPQ
jgi:hypothetical protein